jgi:hypothetical protein
MELSHLITELNSSETMKDFIININNYENKINYIIRQKSMREIMNMSKKIFIKKLKENKLPEFVRSKNCDTDYVALYRDTNSAPGDDYAYNHRERLRTINTKDYKLQFNCYPDLNRI